MAEVLVGTAVSVVALQAPLPHPGGSGRQWYDLQQPNWPELPGARAALSQRLLELSRELPLENTILLGFSQGAAMVLDVGTLAEGLDGRSCAALIGCSGYPHPGWDPQTPHKTKVLLTHGEQDPVVPFAASQALQEQLQAAGHGVELGQRLRLSRSAFVRLCHNRSGRGILPLCLPFGPCSLSRTIGRNL